MKLRSSSLPAVFPAAAIRDAIRGCDVVLPAIADKIIGDVFVPADNPRKTEQIKDFRLP